MFINPNHRVYNESNAIDLENILMIQEKYCAKKKSILIWNILVLEEKAMFG